MWTYVGSVSCESYEPVHASARVQGRERVIIEQRAYKERVQWSRTALPMLGMHSRATHRGTERGATGARRREDEMVAAFPTIECLSGNRRERRRRAAAERSAK